jgi:hypothetical protein
MFAIRNGMTSSDPFGDRVAVSPQPLASAG